MASETRKDMNTVELFFELLRVSVGSAEALSCSPTPEQWRILYTQACRQTLTGVFYAGIEQLPACQRPEVELLLQWYALAERLKALSRKLNAACVAATEHYHTLGFDSVILKGQGNAVLYDDPLLRVPGDIDIWLSGGRRCILSALGDTHGRVLYHHTDVEGLFGIPVEVHFTPSWLSSPWINARLQNYFRKSFAIQAAHTVMLPENAGYVNVPDYSFNLLYQLIHIFRHIFGEGVGLRQLMDYYYLLRSGYPSASDRERLKYMHMGRFASAVSWIMQEIFRLDAAHLPATPDVREGRYVLAEVLRTGNFGKTVAHRKYDFSQTHAGHFFRGVRRAATLVTHFPEEAFWIPAFKLWHFHWRWFKGYL